MKKEQFNVTGMTCAACSARVEKAVGRLPGVDKIAVNLLKNSMVVEYDETALDTQKIIGAVTEAGYGASLKESAQQGKAAKAMQASANDIARQEYEAVKKRLKFDEHKLMDVVNGISELIKLPDPLGKVQLARQLDDGLNLYRVSCPIGVIGIIFEARPDALVQISSLCLKSGNCAILKGGKETARTNKILFDIIYKAATSAGVPEGCMLQAEQHNEIDELLSCHESVDLLIPRGSSISL